MGQGPSESGLHPYLDLHFEEQSSRVYLDGKDTKLATQETVNPCSTPAPLETLDNNNNSSCILSTYNAPGTVC